MRSFPMSNIATTEPCIAPPATTLFKWGWDSNHWVPYMLHFPLWSPRLTHLQLQMKLTKPPGSLRRSNTSTNRFRISYISPMTSTRNTMINIGCHTSSKWVTKFGYICRSSTSMEPIARFACSDMGHTPSLRM